MDENGKVWQKPELIVLVRSKPEEAVLLACKLFNPNSYNPGSNADAWCCEFGNEGCGTQCVIPASS